MSSETTVVTPDLLREWSLPEGGESKQSRGKVLVIGGGARSPGAVILSGVAALRVGAGRITLAVAQSVAGHVAVAVPECGVIALAETAGHVLGAGISAAQSDIEKADAIVVGPGLDDGAETEALLQAFPTGLDGSKALVLDAYALGALAQRPELRERLPAGLVLTPNLDEARMLLGREVRDLDQDVVRLAAKLGAVVACYGHVAAPDGRSWRLGTGASGLGTSGSGDVMAGAIAGFCARGVEPERAAVWGSYVHAVAGDRLAARIGTLGYLARELLPELPQVLEEVGA